MRNPFIPSGTKTNTKEIIQKLINKEIVPDFKGHEFVFDFYINPLKKDFDTIDDNHIYLCMSTLDKVIISFNCTCQYCGNYLESISIDRTTFETTIYYTKKVNGRFKHLELEPCESNYDVIETEIEVDSTLIFANFFLKEDGDYLEDDMKDCASLNITQGLYDIAKFYEKENILFGQTGNMSVYFYQGEEGIVALRMDLEYIKEDFNEIDLSPLELEQIEKYKDYKYLGEVDCNVWRFMIASKNTIKKLNLETKIKGFEVNLPLGRYKMSHYYQLSDKGLLVSEIKSV